MPAVSGTGAAPLRPLRIDAPRRVLDGFGRAVRSASLFAAPRTAKELAVLLRRAAEERIPVTFRGSGRSYGDASLNSGGLVLDLTGMSRMLSWDPVSGIAEAEPGLTIEGLWRRTIEDGFWPAVVPGTMFPTLGGCLGMNIHGKNNFRAGTFGEHVLDFDLLTMTGERVLCSREENPELFHAVIGGAGLLGAVSRVRLKLKRVESGTVKVEALAARSLGEMFDLFEERLAVADYLVGWLDCWGGGRGQIHQANYLPGEEDPQGRASLHVERQGLPPKILGMPRSQIYRFMGPALTAPGTRAVNFAKYTLARWNTGHTFTQSLVAFSFLLDYVPNWQLAYGSRGFIQVQLFVPDDAARTVLPEVLHRCRERGLVSSLGVLKRHRPDPFLMTHGLDGWSLALDFKVPRNREELWDLGREISARVIDAGGRFYLAKDAILRPADFAAAYNPRLHTFLTLKRRVDPYGLLMSDQSRRLLGTA